MKFSHIYTDAINRNETAVFRIWGGKHMVERGEYKYVYEWCTYDVQDTINRNGECDSNCCAHTKMRVLSVLEEK